MESNTTIYDLICIGAGPAGLSAAIYAARAGLNVLVLEQGGEGGKLLSTHLIENWPGTVSITGADLAKNMAAHAREVGAEITWAVVEGILDAEAETKEVKCLGTSYFARSILVASGCQERHLGIPGEEEFRGQGVSYCAVCDGAFFQDCEIVVIGSGDSAFEEGDYLTRYGKKVTLLLRSERVHADRVYIERAEANPKMEVFKNRVVEEIIGSPATGVEKIRIHNVEDDSHYELECQAVFPFIGSVPNTKFLSDLSILDKQGFIEAQADMSTSIPGVYAAGDCRQKVLRQVITAGNDGAIAAQSIAAYLRSR